MKKITLVFSLVLLIVSCQKDSDPIQEEDLLEDLICEDCGIEVTKDGTRLTQHDKVINVKTSLSGKSSKSQKGNSIYLKLKAIVDPLYVVHKGQIVLLNANHVAVKNRRIAVSYSLIGEPYSGGVDVISVPKNGAPNLDGTLVLPHRDIDAVDFSDGKHLLFGGGFDAREYYGGDYPSFLGRYQIQYNKKRDVFSLSEKDLFHSIFGNKLRSIKTINGIITGSGGGNSGVIFAFNEKTNTLIKHESNETEGLFILDTSIEKHNNAYNFVALAFNNDTKELKAFYYDISKKTDIMSFNYEVSLGVFNNMNVEAKHSLTAVKKDRLAVSLGSDGIGLFKINTDSGGNKTAELVQQIKEQILDPNKPNDVVNSFIFRNGVFYIAAGEAGFYIIKYNFNKNRLDEDYGHVEFSEGISVNGLAKSGSDLVLATTTGVSIYTISGL
ncbi:hypothetical protein [Hwangdonia lutea]|uniref:Uncharacterized protein n=1 Tax=Hwangdonia lutea TaxID=3075823 RepID=A0AA97HQU3_9FLAO|nr:hypothetical protein [Hwangdonia sp. SCSIO 19198]WOD43937.1 hypothetical protein RNZ46_01435 [Hwangdonia sp. SCSIO 19198]